MNVIVLLICATFSVVSARTDEWKTLRVKFGPLGIISKAFYQAYWDVPSFLEDANDAGWLTIRNENELNLTAVAWQGEDHRIVPLFDARGWIAGVQIGLSKDELDKSAPPYFKASAVGTFEVKKVLDEVCYTSTLYLVDQQTLKRGGRNSADTLGNGLWFKSGSDHIQVHDDETALQKEGLYTKQNCIPFMGTHYYYNMTENVDLSKLQPFFLLVNHGSINGVGWQTMGRTSHGARDWWDKINKLAVRLTVPHAPKQLAEDVEKFGITSVHIYFKDAPWKITCLS